jgi:hypothetical protein
MYTVKLVKGGLHQYRKVNGRFLNYGRTPLPCWGAEIFLLLLEYMLLSFILFLSFYIFLSYSMGLPLS